jgi:hypothetical protein
MESLDQQNLTRLVGLMLAAGGPPAIPARIDWPLHQALRELHEDSGRTGRRRALPTLIFHACPDVATRAAGASEAVFTLARAGVLRPDGAGRHAVLRPDPGELVAFRRDFMLLEPEVADLVQRAAARWAALVATSAKNRSTARRSSGATVASGTPKRLHELPGSASNASSRRRPPRSKRLATR